MGLVQPLVAVLELLAGPSEVCVSAVLGLKRWGASRAARPRSSRNVRPPPLHMKTPYAYPLPSARNKNTHRHETKSPTHPYPSPVSLLTAVTVRFASPPLDSEDRTLTPTTSILFFQNSARLSAFALALASGTWHRLHSSGTWVTSGLCSSGHRRHRRLAPTGWGACVCEWMCRE